MAKQRPKSKSQQPASPAPRPERDGTDLKTRRPSAASRPRGPAAQASTGPAKRSTYFEAVAVYERGLEAMQRHDYRKAVDLLQSVLRQYPEEKELHERVKLYMN